MPYPNTPGTANPSGTGLVDTVPVIDIGPFLAEGPGAAQVVDTVREACERIGFFTITGHAVPAALVERLYREALAFFDLPLAEKLRVEKPKGTNPRGFAPQGTKTVGKDRDPTLKPSLHESFAIGPLDIGEGDYFHGPAAGSHFAPNLWPARPPALREAMTAYYREMERVSAGVLRIFAAAFGIGPDYFLDRMDHHVSVLRLMHYPGLDSAPSAGEERAAAHTDTTAITILRIDDAPGGLQVRTPAGRGLYIAPVPDAFVVNIGDIMMRWTNDRFVSTMHRVANPPAGVAGRTSRRISIPYFCLPAYDAIIECVPGCEGEGARHPPIASGELLSRRYATTYSISPAVGVAG